MQVHISPSMRRITISTTNGFLDPLKIKVAARYLSHRCLFWTILFMAFLLPFIFITTALITLEEVNKCSSVYCLGRKLGPKLNWKSDITTRQSKHIHNAIMQATKSGLPEGENIPESFNEFAAEVEAHQYDTKTCILKLKAMVEVSEQRARSAKLQEAIYRHFASSGIPKSMHCLVLKLTAEYSSNAMARRELPSAELTYRLTDNTFHHMVVATDNVLAASVVVSSAIKNSAQPQKLVFHVITDKKTYTAMHSWFALNPLPPAIVEVKSVHHFEWLTKDNVPVLQAMETHHDIRRYYHGDHILGADLTVSPTILASKLQARSPKYISILNHLRIYLPQMFPELNKVVFVDDDVVVQEDLTGLWEIDLEGKVNGAVETCRGEDPYVMSKRFKTYFNFSHPLISSHFDPEKCAWAYGMNIFDLQSWRRTDITKTYHYWQRQNLNSNLTLWRLGTLPPALIAFDGYVHAISPHWHMLGLGYHGKSNLESVKKAAVIHYNGQAKPWLDIGFPALRPFWSKYVNYANDFIRRCNILEA